MEYEELIAIGLATVNACIWTHLPESAHSLLATSVIPFFVCSCGRHSGVARRVSCNPSACSRLATG